MNVIKNYKNISVEVKASIAYTFCSILTKCISLITLPIFTRIMTKEEFGLSTVYTSFSSIVVIFISLQLPYGSFSKAMIKYKDDRMGYASTVCSISTILTMMYIIISWLCYDLIVKWVDLPLPLILLIGIEMLFSTSINVWMGYQRFEYKYKKVVVVTLITSIFSTILSLVSVKYAADKGIARVSSNAAVICLVGGVIFVFLIKKGRKIFEKKYWKYALSFNIPLIPYYLSQVIFNQSDRLMIDSMCGRSDAAVYSVAYSLATVLSFVVTSIHNSYTPWIFEEINKKNFKNNSKITLLISAAIAFLLLGVIVITPEVIYIMAGEKYAEAIWVVPPVAMSVLLLYYADLFDCILFYFEAKVFLTVAAIVAAAGNVVLNAFFIQKFGFIAAAYTTLVSYLLLVIVDYLYMVRICKNNAIDKNLYNIKGLVIIFLIFGASGTLTMCLYNYRIIRCLIIALMLFVMFIFRKKIISVLKLIMR